MLLISNCDSDNITEDEIKYAKASLGNIWLMENPTLKEYDLNFHEFEHLINL